MDRSDSSLINNVAFFSKKIPYLKSHYYSEMVEKEINEA